MKEKKKIVMTIAALIILIIIILPLTSAKQKTNYQKEDITKDSKNAPRISIGSEWKVDDDLQEYPDADFTKIQDAVNVATNGDSILVYPGTYIENVDVNKTLNIKSSNGVKMTIVQAMNLYDHVFDVTADHVIINGFTIKQATENAGVFLDADYCEIFNNILSYNYYGISTNTYFSSINSIIKENVFKNNNRGINIGYASGSVTVVNNICKNNYMGIFFGGGDSSVTNNTVEDNTFGIQLYYSDGNNTFSNNTIQRNQYNFAILGFDLYQYIHSIDTSNKVDGKPIYYLVNKQGQQIPSNAGYVGIVNSTNIIVRELTLTSNCEGVLVSYSKYVRVEDVNVTDNRFGIRIHRSSRNTIIDNFVSSNENGIFLYHASAGNPSSRDNIVVNNNVSNNEYGITVWDYSKNNTIINNNVFNNTYGICTGYFVDTNHVYLNNFIDNTYSTYIRSSIVWNSFGEINYTYLGNSYINYLGNYWDDYVGSDNNGDGVGDTSYNNKDNYPLMYPFENYLIISEHTNPIINTQQDISYEESTTGHNVTWTSIDTDPGIYIVYKDKVEIDSDIWLSSVAITVNVDGLAPGEYNYTIIVFDIYGNRATDTVVVTVVEGVIVPPGDNSGTGGSGTGGDSSDTGSSSGTGSGTGGDSSDTGSSSDDVPDSVTSNIGEYILISLIFLPGIIIITTIFLKRKLFNY